MIKEFSDNVQRLFNDIVTEKTKTQSHTAEELLALLRRMVTQPIKIIEEASHVCVVYYNVSVIMPDNLSEIKIAYNSEYQMTFNKISSFDLHQLSEFILALERDIPKWKHIWVADDKLKKEQAKIDKSVKSAMRQLRSWMLVLAKDDEAMIEKFRIKYMNGYFLMRFKISGASTVCRVYFNDVDRCIPAIINTINRINDMIPELRNTLIDDGQQYYLMGDNYSMGQILNDDKSGEPFSVVHIHTRKNV